MVRVNCLRSDDRESRMNRPENRSVHMPASLGARRLTVPVLELISFVFYFVSFAITLHVPLRWPHCGAGYSWR